MISVIIIVLLLNFGVVYLNDDRMAPKYPKSSLVVYKRVVWGKAVRVGDDIVIGGSIYSVLGITGDTIQIKSGLLFSNNRKIIFNNNLYVPQCNMPSQITVCSNEVFLMNVNIRNLNDSRMWGCVKLTNFEGYAMTAFSWRR